MKIGNAFCFAFSFSPEVGRTFGERKLVWPPFVPLLQIGLLEGGLLIGGKLPAALDSHSLEGSSNLQCRYEKVPFFFLPTPAIFLSFSSSFLRNFYLFWEMRCVGGRFSRERYILREGRPAELDSFAPLLSGGGGGPRREIKAPLQTYSPPMYILL